MTKDPRVYLAHILECLQKIERFTVEGKERFLKDPMVHDAVLRNFEVIREAASGVRQSVQVSEVFRGQKQAEHHGGVVARMKEDAGRQ